MPKYHIEIAFGDGRRTPDQDGFEFADRDAAVLEANSSLRELLAHALLSKLEELPSAAIVKDSTGREVGIITTAELIPK